MKKTARSGPETGDRESVSGEPVDHQPEQDSYPATSTLLKTAIP